MTAPERESVLRYTVDLVSLIFDNGGYSSQRLGSHSPGLTSGDRSGHSKYSMASSAAQHGNSSIGGCASSCKYEGNRPSVVMGSGGNSNTGMSSGHRSAFYNGAASSGGAISLSNGYTGTMDETGINRSLNLKRAQLAVTLSSCWILHYFFAHPIPFVVRDLKCLAFGAVLLAGKVGVYIFHVLFFVSSEFLPFCKE